MTGRSVVEASLGALFFLLISGSAGATTINVPADQTTLQGAINAASNGDIVEVAAGTYFENINFHGKAIAVRSSSGPLNTTIDGSQKGAVVTFSSGETGSSVLSGFTITNGLSYPFPGGGISIANSSPTISGNVISDNAACGGGDGIWVNFGSPLITGNSIIGNHQGSCSGDGGGVAVVGAGAAQIISNTISNNSTSAGNGGGIAVDSGNGNVVIEDNLISGNSASGLFDGSGLPAAEGGGIAYHGSNALFVQNLIINNTADLGGGIYYAVRGGSSGPLLVNNAIAGNTSTRNLGSAVFADGFAGPSELFNNILLGGSQNAVFCSALFNAIPPVFENNDAFSTGSGAFEGSCTTSAGQYGNISADPLFANPAANDYHLSPSSPAIDAGTNLAPDLPAADFYGNPRIVAGTMGGPAIIDIGVAEFQTQGVGPTATPTATPTPGNIINVPTDVSSIQAAIDAAKNGDIIEVAPDTYFEAISFNGKAIQVVSVGGPQNTIIDGHGLGSVVSFISGETTSTVLSGFTITGGLVEESGGGGGVLITNSSPMITNNIISGNEACGSGGGIYVLNSSPIIQSNVIEDNSQEASQLGSCTGGSGGGISVAGTGSSQILSNTIANNSWKGGDGGGLALNGGAPLIMNNLITGNLASGRSGEISGIVGSVSRGGGILIQGSNAQIIQNIIVGNTADLGAGIGMSLSGAGSEQFFWGPLIVNNTVEGNQATQGNGSELFGDFTTGTQLFNNLLISGGSQSALYCAKDPNLRIVQRPIVRNNDVFSVGGNASGGKCPFSMATNGNISRAPLFNDASSNDFHLQAGSPAIDAGTNSALDIPNNDFYDAPRVVAARSRGQATVDIGASEFQPNGLPSPTPTPAMHCTSVSAAGKLKKMTTPFENPLVAGYEFSVEPGHPAAMVTFSRATVTLNLTCRQGQSEPLTIGIPFLSYRIAEKKTVWIPQGAIFQGSGPTSCPGAGLVDTVATFSAQVCSTDNVSSVKVRFHYRGNSESGWSKPVAVIP